MRNRRESTIGDTAPLTAKDLADEFGVTVESVELLLRLCEAAGAVEHPDKPGKVLRFIPIGVHGPGRAAPISPKQP